MSSVTRDDELGDLTDLLNPVEDDPEGENGTYDGASDQEPYFRGSPVTPDMDSPVEEADPERVLLVNIRYPQETFYLPDENGQFTGNKVQFMDSYLNCTREEADAVLAAAPWVYEEPKTGGDPFVFDKTGFRTRNSAGYQEYIQHYYSNL